MKKRQMEVDRLLGRDAMADKESAFKRMEDRVISLSAEVEAIGEISGDELTARLRAEELEAELAKLKDKMKSEK